MFIPESLSFDITWAKARFISSPWIQDSLRRWYIKVVIVTKITFCLPDLVIITESICAAGGPTVVYKTQHIDIIDIRYFKQSGIAIQLIRRGTSI